MKVSGVYWASSFREHYIYFVLNEAFCPWSPLYKVIGQENKWVCTIEANDFYGRLYGEPNEQKHLIDSSWDQGDTGNSPAIGDHTSLIINPPGSISSFAETLFRLERVYDKQETDLDFIAGKQDSAAWVNTILKIAGISEARRMRGSGRGLPHQNLLDESNFGVAGSIKPVPSVPGVPNAPNPPGMPSLEPGQKLHIVKSGDWLSRIAITYYGDYKLYPKIHTWQDNKNGSWNLTEIGPNPDLIKPGMRIIIPERRSII